MALSPSASAFMKGYEWFMCIVQKPPEQEQSFEELRAEDYLKAYMTTGRPPPPVLDQPETPKAREALGLPPLFSPIAVESSPSTSTSELPAEKAITSPSNLPTIQLFQTTKTVLDERFQSITAQPTFSWFSLEELRHYAYLSGNIMPPIPQSSPLQSEMLVPHAVSARLVHPYYAHDSPATAYASARVDPGPPESYMSITASPKFNKHSFEELRVACLLAGKELTSSEIPTRGSLPAPTAPPLLGRPRGETLSIATPVPSFRV
ncbi:hypothetical protein K503DRAFT_745810 [Rhizopogon vinicolor AM-OR11-026]|uniref:Uncharacterized protein n=1 Tax=Rhizopogon vinicolor AM-OR11-026 TaxID=1314800 RepID=A0A1B7MSE1_9AGAM|nr:hypothetical protein K503DRAFT_745810 [Rhizopogon vinicolor AM-OR11-026]